MDGNTIDRIGSDCTLEKVGESDVLALEERQEGSKYLINGRQGSVDSM